VYIHHPIKYSLAIGPLVFVSAPCDCTETAGFITHPSVCVCTRRSAGEVNRSAIRPSPPGPQLYSRAVDKACVIKFTGCTAARLLADSHSLLHTHTYDEQKKRETHTERDRTFILIWAWLLLLSLSPTHVHPVHSECCRVVKRLSFSAFPSYVPERLFMHSPTVEWRVESGAFNCGRSPTVGLSRIPIRRRRYACYAGVDPTAWYVH
jgi:hypothetical protein